MQAITLTFGRQGLSAIIQFLNVLVIAKFLGPEGNGVYSMALIASLTLGLFLNLGLGQANTYYIGRKEFSVSQVVSLSMSLFSIYVCILIAAVVFIGHWIVKLFDISYSYLWVLSVCVPVVVLNSWLLGVFQGKEDFSIYNVAMLLSPVSSFLITVFLVFLGVGEGVFYYFGWFLGNFISTVYLFFKISKSKSGVKEGGGGASYFVKALSYGWKAHCSNLCSYGMYRVDIYILSFFYGSAVVGVYSVAQQIIERFWMIAQAVSTVLFPRLTSLVGVDGGRSKVGLTALSAKWVFLSSVLCGILVYFLVTPFINTIFGPEFSKAALAVQILLPGMVFFNLSRIFASYTSSAGFVGYMAIVSCLCLMFSVGVNSVLTPVYGIEGAALATSISYVFSFFLGFFVFVKVSR
ncbi:flippase [Ectopseudomonas hydrolytica]|uniref:flippase n=1 Tax=Ectopseudomonas hydrolytica TaxID=2493633 RepID=UPI003C2C883B